MRGTRIGIKLQGGNFQINLNNCLLKHSGKKWFSGEIEFHIFGGTDTEAVSPV